MNKGVFSKILPHLIAVIIFLLVAVIYCKPVLEGKVLNQHDITNWKGAVQQSIEYSKTHGQYPLWTNSVFSGMPTFEIAYEANNYIPRYVHPLFTLWLPNPIHFFFLACICFYFLCIVLRIRPWVGIMGGLAFAYATYNPVIIGVGHETKMWTIAYMPALLASMILIYEKKYWIGAALTALFTSLLVVMNHPQVDYYFFIAAGIMTIFYVARWIRNKEFKHLGMAVAFTLLGAGTGLLTNAVALLSTYEYQKETIRGMSSPIVDSGVSQNAKTGLDKDYAFSYSMVPAEPFVMMFPRLYGGSYDKEEVSQESSKAVEALTALPQQLQQNLRLSYYWGGMTKPSEAGTAGPPYSGAIICFLAILGMFILDNKHKWWIFTAIVLAIIMSWGSYFEGFNSIFYNYLPLFNKFRAPSMILVIPQLLLPVLAVLCVDRITKETDKKSLLPNFKKGLIATGVVFLLLFLLYISFDFLGFGDKQILRQVRGMNNAEVVQGVDSFYSGLKADRKSLMIGDIFRSLGFIAVAAVLLFLFIRNAIKPLVVIAGLTILILIDLLSVDIKYLNSENYVDPIENEGSFQQSNADKEILADKSFYRVFNVSGNAFSENITSYYYNSVGGYNPVKLRIYNDLIERQIGKEQPNLIVFNMLNTKYFIQKNQSGITEKYQKNDSALGPVWLVKSIHFVKNATEEMAALNSIHPKEDAFVQESFRSSIPFMPQPDGSASIQLIKNDNDIVTYSFNAASNQFAVFSEIYYKAGWKAFIDGKEAPIVKCDYVFRGLAVPSGKHNIEFRFHPEGYYRGREITSIFTIVLLALIAVAVFMEWRRSKSSVAPSST